MQPALILTYLYLPINIEFTGMQNAVSIHQVLSKQQIIFIIHNYQTMRNALHIKSTSPMTPHLYDNLLAPHNISLAQSDARNEISLPTLLSHSK